MNTRTLYLWSKEKHGDFDIEFEYTLQPGGNRGFYFRVADVNDPVEHGIEVQILDAAPHAGEPISSKAPKRRDRRPDHPRRPQ